MSDQSQGSGWWQATDGKWYPPEQHPDYRPPVAPPPPPQQWSAPAGPAGPPQQKKMNGCLKAALIGGVLAIVLGVGCVAVIGNAADDVDKELDEKEASIEDDVELVRCFTNDAGWMAADVRVTNDSSERSNYGVEVAFTSPDGSEQYESGFATISALEPNQTANDTAETLTDAVEGFTCKIIDVTRFTDEP